MISYDDNESPKLGFQIGIKKYLFFTSISTPHFLCAHYQMLTLLNIFFDWSV